MFVQEPWLRLRLEYPGTTSPASRPVSEGFVHDVKMPLDSAKLFQGFF